MIVTVTTSIMVGYLSANVMRESIVISEEERKRLTTGRQVNRPKYTFFALNKAVEYSGANQKDILGDVEAIYEEFEREHPDGDSEDWREFYFERYDGEQRLENATEQAYDKFLTIREAIQQINRDDIHDFIRGFTLYGTYENRNIREAARAKLLMDLNNCQPAPDEAPADADIEYGDFLLQIVTNEDDDNDQDVDGVRKIRAEEKQDGRIIVDLSGLNQSLDEF